MRKSNWHDCWEDRWKAARGGVRPVPKLRARDPKFGPDVFREYFSQRDAERIIDAVRKPLKGAGWNAAKLADALNKAAIFWAAESRAETRDPGRLKDPVRKRANLPRNRLIREILPQIFQPAFELKATASVVRDATERRAKQKYRTDRKRPNKTQRREFGNFPALVDGPYPRFVVASLTAIGYRDITAEAVREILRAD